MWKRLNSNQMCEQFSYKEVSYGEVLLYIHTYNKLLYILLLIIYIYKCISNFNISIPSKPSH